MDNFIGTLVFLLPGVMAYFWLRAFGINPVTKHNPAEFTAVSALLWMPVSFITLLLYNLVVYSLKVSSLNPIWTTDDLKIMSGSIVFLSVFLVASLIISFIFSVYWSTLGFNFQQWLTNNIRGIRGIAPFSNTTSVWDEIFLNDDSQVVEIGKIDKPENSMIGCIRKASRPFEPERSLYLDEVEYFTKLVKDNGVPVQGIYFDVKCGTYIKVFDPNIIDSVQ